MPIDPNKAKKFTSQGGRFFAIKRELKPGQSIEAKLVDITEIKPQNPQWAIKGEDFIYEVALTIDGEERRWSINGKDTIRQVFRCLFPEGPENPVVPCWVQITRRVERTTKQGEVEVKPLQKA